MDVEVVDSIKEGIEYLINNFDEKKRNIGGDMSLLSVDCKSKRYSSINLRIHLNYTEEYGLFSRKEKYTLNLEEVRLEPDFPEFFKENIRKRGMYLGLFFQPSIHSLCQFVKKAYPDIKL